MKENVKLLIALIILVSLAFLFFGVDRSDPQSKGTLKIGVIDDGADEWLIDFAESKGFFEEAGLEIEKIEAGTNATALLSSGEVDVGSQMAAAALITFFNDEDIKMIFSTRSNRDYYGVGPFSENEIDKIRRVGVPRVGGAFHIALIPVLEDLGINLDNIDFVTTGPSAKARIALLEKGEIDFTLIGKEDLGNLTPNKFAFIEPSKLYRNYSVPYGYLTYQKTIDSKGPELQAFIEVILATQDYFGENRAELVSYFQENLDLSKNDAEIYYDGIKDNSSDSSTPNEQKIKRTAEVVINFAEPKNPKRDLGEFIYTGILDSINR